MKNTDIYILYRFSEGKASGTNEITSKYRVIFLFNHNGLIPKGEFKKICNEFSVNTDDDLIYFATKEELLGFSHSLGEYLNVNTAHLLSVNDFNIGIESCHDLQAFKEIFNRYGTTLPCLDTKPNQKSMFSKFF